MIFLIADKSTERLRYILDIIFGTILKTPYSIIDLSEKREFDFDPEKAVINYSSHNIPGTFRIPVTEILFEKGISNIQPDFRKNSFIKIFHTDEIGFELDYDIFAASFYLITEYEKYQKQVFDHHGRYKEDEYTGYKNGLFKDPLINIYAEDLWTRLFAKHKHLKRQESGFDYEITIDVDHPWAFLNRGFSSYAGFLKDLLLFRFNNLKFRYQSLKSGNDPFYTFDWLYKVCPVDKTRFFFLVGNESKFDIRHNPDHPQFAELINTTKSIGFECGIHPSYNSYLSETKIAEEKKMLSDILGGEVTSSRQHFLRYNLPLTNRALIEAGIRHDYTTSMINGIGFRNGIANDFKWFDVERDQITELILHPCMAMDVSLKNYLNYDSEYAFNQILDLIEKTRNAGGKFVLIWHNSNLSSYDGWQDWKGAFSELLKYLEFKANEIRNNS